MVVVTEALLPCAKAWPSEVRTPASTAPVSFTSCRRGCEAARARNSTHPSSKESPLQPPLGVPFLMATHVHQLSRILRASYTNNCLRVGRPSTVFPLLASASSSPPMTRSACPNRKGLPRRFMAGGSGRPNAGRP